VHRADHLRCADLVEFAAQVCDVDLDGVACELLLSPSSGKDFRQLVARQDLALPAQEGFQQPIFLARDGDRLIPPRHRMARRAKLERAVRDIGGRHRRRCPPGNRSQTCAELAEVDGLGHVVVRAEIEHPYAILDAAARGHHDEADVGFSLTQHDQKTFAADVRKTQVQQDTVVPVRTQCDVQVLPFSQPVHGIARSRERRVHRRAEHFIVF